jgi:phosphatidylglycerophosphate synthase
MIPSLIVSLAILSMAVYAALRRAPDADAQRKGASFLLGVGNFFLHWFLWCLGPLEALLTKVGATADVLNVAGLLFGVASGTFIALGHLEAGGWSIAAGGACDILDGRLARAQGVVSLYGKFIDSTLDRFVDVLVLLGFVFFFASRTPLGAFAAAAAMGGSLLVSYTQSRGETVGIPKTGGLMQRAERVVFTCLVCLFDPALSARLGRPVGSVALWAMVFTAVTTFGTAAYRTIVIASRLRGKTS